MRFEVAGLGNALVDALVRIPNDAVLEELSLTRGLMHPVDDARWQLAKATVEDLGVELHTGGSCANTIATLGLMGLQTTFAARWGMMTWGDSTPSACTRLAVMSACTPPWTSLPARSWR